MWKQLLTIGLTLCTIALADDTHSPKAPESSVSIECHGRLRSGVVSVGGETTGTTITFNRIVYELQLQSEADQKFAKDHHKQPVIATGTLRKVAGVETKARWIIDVQTLAERDPAKDKEGALLNVQGTLQATPPDGEMTIRAVGQVWPIDLSADAQLQARAKTLVGQQVQLKGNLEETPDAESPAPVILRVKTLASAATGQ